MIARFVPPAIAEKYKLSIPDYGFGTNQIVVSVPNSRSSRTPQITSKSSVLNSNDKESLSVIYVTTSTTEDAKKIAAGLLEKGLVACVNLIPQVTSMYIWKGKMEESSEAMMMMKVSETTKEEEKEEEEGVKSGQIQCYFVDNISRFF